MKKFGILFWNQVSSAAIIKSAVPMLSVLMKQR